MEYDNMTQTSLEPVVEQRANLIRQELINSPDVIKLAGSLDVSKTNEILEFGNEPAKEISKFADSILGNIRSNSVEGSSEMIKQLTAIMKKFDVQDFQQEEEKKGFFSKLFKKGQDSVNGLMQKYKSMGGEIDKIYTEISGYKKDLNDANIMLESMYEKNFEYYKQLEKYIAAGYMMIDRIKQNDIPKLEEAAMTGDQLKAMELDNAKTSLEMLEQRVYDLEMAKMVSLQTAPQIKMIQNGNYKLISKIHSAFVITIPVFKNGIVQAVALKRQKLVSDSMNELDKTTNELLMKNAQNIKNQSIDIARMSSGSSVKIETLENTWQTIMEGIEETQRIQKDNEKLRIEGTAKIQEMNEKMKQKLLK